MNIGPRLYDAHTDRDLGPATTEQINAAATHPDGWITINMNGHPITPLPDLPHHHVYVHPNPTKGAHPPHQK